MLDSAPIRGALKSVIGDNYMLHPHRALVRSEPLDAEQRKVALRGDEDGPPMGEGSRSYSYWHKDTYMPLGRTRYHVPRCVFLFYFPQDTPVEMGPTRVIPGSQYQDRITEADHAFAYVPDQIRAGSCLLTAYDIAHAGISNLTDQTRFMVKFNVLRTRNPQEPSWNGGTGHWKPPAEHLGRYELPQTWSCVWDWMRGCRQIGIEPGKDIGRHLSHLNGADQHKRLEAVYENGVLRPLEPVDLEEHQRVTVTIEDNGTSSEDGPEGSLDEFAMPTNGADLVAYWEKKGLIGTRPDIVDSVAHARRLRHQAETRHS